MKKQEKRKYIFIVAFVMMVMFFIVVTLADFYTDIQERVYDKQIDAMKNISMQGSAVVEKKLEGLVNTLYGLAEYLHEKDISDERNINRLKEFIEKKDIGFQRLGIADVDGNAKVTNGEQLNISEREYFQKCIKEKRGVSEIRKSTLVDKPICIISVPILRDDEEAIGIIYGVVEIGVFQIYENTVLESSEQYIQLVDLEGNYILKEESSLIGKRDNIFDGINSVNSQNSSEEIWEAINNEQQIYTEISDGVFHEIVYFTPLKLNDWCVVTVIDYSEVINSMNYILGNDVYLMILKVICATILFFLMLMYYSWQEHKQIRIFNDQLVMDEKIVQIAAEKSGFLIMNYSRELKRLRFINHMILNIEFPDYIDNTPEEIERYAAGDEEMKKQIQAIFTSMDQDYGVREFPLTVTNDERMIYFRVQLITPVDKNGEMAQCIGVMEDMTEEQKLQEKASRDPLTGLYNRSSAKEEIEHCVKNSNLQPGMTHAYMIMDVDNFKTLNDTLGHLIGDQALQDVAEVLKHHFRPYDIVCRLGGDEFLVFMKNIPENVVERNVESLLKKLNLTYRENENEVRITVSAGIILVSDPKMEFEEMYRKADNTLYQVKQESKNGFKIYDQTKENVLRSGEKIIEKQTDNLQSGGGRR